LYHRGAAILAAALRRGRAAAEPRSRAVDAPTAPGNAASSGLLANAISKHGRCFSPPQGLRMARAASIVLVAMLALAHCAEASEYL
jgi:hypothetical protein